MTASVVWHTTMSLDGFVAGPDDAMDWVFDLTDRSPAGDRTIRTTGAVLAGRRTYETGRNARHRPYGGAWSGPVYVLTHRPADDPDVTFLSTDLREAVDRARAAADGKNLVLLGARLGSQCLQQGLVDEILVHLAPVLLGDGIRLYDVPGGEGVRLRRTECSTAGQITDLRFRPADVERQP
ncbi:dihydrofolate reductase family protein [Streptomyces sp. NPDC005813]|uniref:dihydrofolate reductase family protein n=1 Tax=Streptomyces sp. NPDC005813 TaxID=3155592 RepID=UPI0033FBDFC8